MPILLIGILGGTLLASALQTIFGIGSTMAANKYNSPRAQRNRLRKAGLPLAYMYRGNVATQSEVPKLSIDPHLGTLADVQGKKLKEDTTAQNIANQVAQGELDWLNTVGAEGITNQKQMLELGLSQKNAERFIKEHERELKQIELWVENNAFAEGIQLNAKRQALKKAKQQIENLLIQAGLMEQLKKIRGFEEQLNKSLTEDLNSMPDWISSLLKIILIATKR